MCLKFYAVKDTLVDVPGGHVVGQVPRYVGREFVPPEAGNAGAHPATKEPYECESDSDEGRRLMHLCHRDGDLYPADEATAAACGVKLKAVEFADGAWSETTQTPPDVPQEPSGFTSRDKLPEFTSSDTLPVKEPATDG